MRCEDWVTRLAQYTAAQHTRPFSYDGDIGNDCCTFSFGAIEAVTGIDVGQAFRGKYRTRREARALMRAYCGKPSLEHFLERLMAEHGFKEVPPLFAGRGDAVLLQTTRRRCLGVMDFNGLDVLSMGDGIRRTPITAACRAWRIT